jgi:hypothetical protein
MIVPGCERSVSAISYGQSRMEHSMAGEDKGQMKAR